MFRDKLQASKSQTSHHYIKKSALEERISNHFLRVSSRFPFLQHEEPSSPGIALPSSFNSVQSPDDAYQLYRSYEFELRVGHTHFLLQRVRNAVISNNHHGNLYKEAKGYDAKEKVSAMHARASRKKQAAGLIYQKKNYYKTLMHLKLAMSISDDELPTRLKGLRELNVAEDARYNSNLNEHTGSYLVIANNEDSWIWFVSMLEGERGTTSEEIQDRWQTEGETALQLS